MGLDPGKLDHGKHSPKIQVIHLARRKDDSANILLLGGLLEAERKRWLSLSDIQMPKLTWHVVEER